MFTETEPPLAHRDSGGDGELLVLLPGAGDIQSEYRLLAPILIHAGYRVVTADLPGHGESAPAASYGVAQTATAIATLIRHLDAGPATVIGCSFAPAAALWAAAENPENAENPESPAAPDLIRALASISPHIEEAHTFSARIQSWLMSTILLRGPSAAGLWAAFYRGWHKGSRPEDLDEHIAAMSRMWKSPRGRRAARETLVANRDGLNERLENLTHPSHLEHAAHLPTLTIFGTADDHFADPTAEARSISERLNGTMALIDGAGHYPHVEQPDAVGRAIITFMKEIR